MNQNLIINSEQNYSYFKNLDNKNLVHLFTLKPFNFNKKFISDDVINEQYKNIEAILDYKFRKILKPIQTHTNIVKCVTEDNMNETFKDVDGLITNQKGIALVTSLADCQGILLYDKEKQVIGNIHSGWKGTLNRIIENAINLMKNEYHSNPNNIEAYISPSIQKCCFEVDADVKELFENEFTDIDIASCITLGEIKENKQKYYIDTVKINEQVLVKLGLSKNNIISSTICSKCNSNIIHSHRQDKDLSGRNIALICLK